MCVSSSDLFVVVQACFCCCVSLSVFVVARVLSFLSFLFSVTFSLLLFLMTCSHLSHNYSSFLIFRVRLLCCFVRFIHYLKCVVALCLFLSQCLGTFVENRVTFIFLLPLLFLFLFHRQYLKLSPLSKLIWSFLSFLCVSFATRPHRGLHPSPLFLF